MSRITVGVDLVQISRIAESLTAFGERFLQRIFTDGEIAYASAAPECTAERLAARFAAKEAAKKALALDGVSWRDLEVRRQTSGACELVLHGKARILAGAAALALSMSHEGDYATAVVVASQSPEVA
jgi:holo-[acyl-carrier protein] synthase